MFPCKLKCETQPSVFMYLLQLQVSCVCPFFFPSQSSLTFCTSPFYKPYTICFQLFHNNFGKISCSTWPNQTSIPVLSILLQFTNSVLHSPVFFSVLMFCFFVFTKNSGHLYSSHFLISPPIQVQLSHRTINNTSNQIGCDPSVILIH